MSKLFSRTALFAVSATFFAFSGTAHAQASDTASATGSATIVLPISIAKNTDLAFGSIARGATGENTVVIDETTGARTLTGDGEAALVGSTGTRATYTVTGETGATFSISVGSTVDLTSGENTLELALASSASSGTLTGGTASFGVGGSITIDEDTPAGAYIGNFDVTVAYN